MVLKKVIATILSIISLFVLVGCSVLPVEEGYESGSSMETDADIDAETGMIIREKTPEEERAAYIEDYKLRYVFGMLMHLEPIPTNA